MQTVTDRWYVIYARVATAVAAVLLLLGIASMALGNATDLKSFGFSVFTCILMAIIVIYYFAGYKFVSRRNSSYNASLVITGILVATTFILMESNSGLHSWFVILWFIEVLTAGIFGNYAIIGSGFLILFYFLLENATMHGATARDAVSLAMLGNSILLAGLSYVIWHSRYVDSQSQHVSHLNKLLKSKQLQSETLIQAIAEGVIVVDLTGSILLMNPAASNMLEWPIDEATGIDVRNVMVFQDDKGQPLDDLQNPFRDLSTVNEPLTLTLNLVSKKGSAHIVTLVISPVRQQGTQDLAASVVVFRDVTAARAEEQRRADFISTASHEMRTPVAAIEGYLALALNDKVTKIDSKARDFLMKAHESAQHLGQLFQDLLTSAKAEDGRLVSHPKVIEMGAFLTEVVDNLKFGAQKKGLLTDFTIGANQGEGGTANNKVVLPLYYVLADPDRLREVITNIFDNAVKYTDTGKISIGLTGNDKVVQLFIKDTGQGIPKDDIPHLFQKFYRVDNTATRTIGGTGLGLFICKKIVELYNGKIWVDSVFEQGSTFYINLPRLTTVNAEELMKQTEAGQELVVPK